MTGTLKLQDGMLQILRKV